MNLLEINNLSIGYKRNIIFPNITLAENAPCLVALVGSNGRGKSTLLKTIAGLEHSCGGEFLFEGKTLSSLSPKAKSELLAFVGSTIERADYLSVEEMLSINAYYRTNWLGSITPEEKQSIRDALKMVGLEGFENRQSSNLSDGEYQRVTIAGALVQNSKIILLDEPTAFLDIANKFLISKLLRTIAHQEKKLIIFSTHDLRLAMEVADKLWVMTSSEIVSDTPENLLRDAKSNGGVGSALDNMFEVEGVTFDASLKSFVFQ